MEEEEGDFSLHPDFKSLPIFFWIRLYLAASIEMSKTAAEQIHILSPSVSGRM